MQGREFITRGAAKLHVSYAAFQDGVALFKACNKVMLENKLVGDGEPKPETTLLLFGDENVYAWYLRCAEKATYNGRKINADLFDDPKTGDQAGRDLLEIFDTIVSFNTSRFFLAASSASKVQSPAA